MTTYTLQVLELAAGKATFKLHSELAGLTVPSFPSLVSDSETVEGMDTLEVNAIEMADMEFSYTEDYTHHSGGFWATVLAGGKAEIQILLNEGGGDTHFFWGEIVPEASGETETDLRVGYEKRRGSFRARSILAKLEAVTIPDLHTEVLSHATGSQNVFDVTGDLYGWDQGEYSAIKLKEIVASMLALGFSQAYDVSLVEVPFNTVGNPTATLLFGVKYDYWNGSAKVTVSDTPQKKFEDLWTLISAYRGSPLFLTYPMSLLASTADVAGTRYGNGDNWQERFPHALEALAALAKTFLYIPRHDYVPGTGKHKIQLIDRTHSFPEVVTFGSPSESVRLPQTELRVKSVQFSRRQFAFAVPASVVRNIGGVVAAGEGPDSTDVRMELEWFPTYGEGQVLGGTVYPVANNQTIFGERLYYEDDLVGGTVGLYRVGRVAYYKNSVDLYVEPTTGGVPNPGNLHYCLAEYFYNRFGPGRGGFERTYKGMKGTKAGAAGSHTYVRPGTNTMIDGVTYYASEVGKNLFRNTLRVKWVGV